MSGLSKDAEREADIQETIDLMYAAMEGHYWVNGRCACGWTKPAHSIGHKHHLADILARAGFAHTVERLAGDSDGGQ